MFLFTATKSELDNTGILQHKVRHRTGFYVITAAVDNTHSRSKKTNERIEILQVLNTTKKDPPWTELSTIHFDEATKKIIINQPTNSGEPIYFHVNKRGEFFCASHVHLLKSVGVRLQENKDVLPEFLIYRYVLPPKTLFKDIYKVLSGAQATISLREGGWHLDSIDTLKHFQNKKAKESLPASQVYSTCQTLLDDAIKQLPFSANQIGMLLSGGLDSSILCKVTQQHFELATTYSGGYPFEDECSNVEKEYALSAAKAFGTKHEYYEPTQEEYVRGVVEAISLAEEPLHHLQTVIIHLMLKNSLAKDKKLVLSGMGADGVYGNEFEHQIYLSEKPLWQIAAKPPFLSALKLCSKLMSKGKYFVKFLEQQKTHSDFEDVKNMLWTDGQYGDVQWVKNYCGVDEEAIVAQRKSALEPYRDASPYEQLYILNVLGHGTVTQSIWSKIALGHDKLMYYPFYEPSLIDLMRTVNKDVKLERPKNVLMHVARSTGVPDFIVDRKKSGFGINKKGWATPQGPLSAFSRLVGQVFGKNIVAELQSVEGKKAMTYWNALNYAVWKRLCIDGLTVQELCKELSCSKPKPEQEKGQPVA